MKEKSILEQALLQVQTLEEAVKANAKGILASTMKQELNELLKESMENEEEVAEDVTNPEGEEEDMSDDAVATDDVPAADDNTEPSLDNPATEEGSEVDDLPIDDVAPEGDGDDVLDMTGASHDEVLKVFKAMKPEDGIIVKKDGNKIEVTTDEDEFIIKLDDVDDDGTEETPELPVDTEIPADDVSDDDEVATDDEGGEDLDDTSDMDDEEGSTDDSEDSDDEDDDETLAEEKQATKPYTGAKKAAKNAPYTGAKKAGENGPYSQKKGKKSEVKEEDSVEEETTEDEVKEESGAQKVELGAKNKPVNTKPGKTGPYEKEVKEESGAQKVELGAKNKPVNTKPGKTGPYEKEVKEDDETIYEIELDGESEATEGEQTESARTKGSGYKGGLKSKNKWKAGNKRDEINEEVEKLRKQNDEYKKALVLFKDKLNEVAVFNANLAYATRLFTEHSTTKQEKLDIMKRFDTVSTMNESKNLFNTIKTELESKKPVTENVIEKIASTPSTSSTEVLSESKAYENPQFKRMKDLMNKIK
jgi:hypothetical protein